MAKARLSGSLLARRATPAATVSAAGVFKTGGKPAAGLIGRSDLASSVRKPNHRLGLLIRGGLVLCGVAAVAAITAAGTVLVMSPRERSAVTIAPRAGPVASDAVSFVAAGIGAPLPIAEVALTPSQQAVPDPVAPAPAPRISAEEVANLLTSGDTALRTGDITTARLYYERATESENPQAALRLGKTYDPTYLALNGLNGVYADAAVAARWYRYAQALGSPEAGAALAAVVGSNGTANPSKVDKLFEQFLSRTSGKGQ